MYLDFYGFWAPPFDLAPNPQFLFLTSLHREALATLRHGIATAKGIVLLIGEAGTGKTTLVRAAVDAESNEEVRCLCLNNPTLTRHEFIEFLARGFGLSPEAAQSKAALLIELERRLIEDRAAGVIHALIVDEAQSVPYELLEEIRLLANMETETQKLLPVVLAGQPELARRLNDVNLRQLKQRIALRCDLAPLSLQDTAAYIATRIRIAGGESSRVFTRQAVMLIHERSQGIPRTISVLCDNALVSGFALDCKPVGRGIVLEVCRDLDLHYPGVAAEPRTERIIAAPSPDPSPVPAADEPEPLPAPRRFSLFGIR
ncbi:MAG TPA: AAA family ATPase [Vicinamibacterales bacterium]|jgi:type II secretory pathway predicted ATPase ExeA|nr:AAA family ATPase [Vicinamibacterales bacterium]